MLANGPRLACNPPNAILNYLYALVEGEATIACQTVGLDALLGIFHTDQRNRPSLALDTIEPVRPIIDAYVLAMLSQRTLARQDFAETRQGACRLTPRLALGLAETSTTGVTTSRRSSKESLTRSRRAPDGPSRSRHRSPEHSTKPRGTTERPQPSLANQSPPRRRSPTPAETAALTSPTAADATASPAANKDGSRTPPKDATPPRQSLRAYEPSNKTQPTADTQPASAAPRTQSTRRQFANGSANGQTHPCSDTRSSRAFASNRSVSSLPRQDSPSITAHSFGWARKRRIRGTGRRYETREDVSSGLDELAAALCVLLLAEYQVRGRSPNVPWFRLS
jgi:hypothetical protein